MPLMIIALIIIEHLEIVKEHLEVTTLNWRYETFITTKDISVHNIKLEIWI